jgi:hypothetical protein
MSSSKQAACVGSLLASIALAAALAGCGNGKEDRSKLLSATRATQLRSSLDELERLIDDGDCEGAANSAVAFEQKVSSLPARLNASLRDALTSGAAQLERLVENQCEPAGATGPTLQTPEPTNEGQGKKGKGKAKGKNKKNTETTPDEGTTGHTIPDENLGITTP